MAEPFQPGADENSRSQSGINLTGKLLIAEPELHDPNFLQTVILVIHHDEQGAFGLVLNRPGDAVVRDVLPEYAGLPSGNLGLYVGGPVEQNRVFVIHSGLPDGAVSEHAIHPASGVIFEPDFSIMDRVFRAEDALGLPKDVRFCVGYAGWGAGQLEHELVEAAWTVIPASADLVFEPDASQVWKKALKEKGGAYWVLAEMGFKPSMN